MSDPQLGQLFALLSTVSFAFASVFVSKSALTKGNNGVLFSVFTTMVFSCLLWLILDENSFLESDNESWWEGIVWFVLAGVLAMAFGRALLYASIRHLGVTRSSSVKRLNPFFTVLLAFIILSEPITGLDALGMMAIASAFGLLIYKSGYASQADLATIRLPASSYMWGLGSALAYAFAYIARKYGLINIDAPVFGTMISAISGFAFFVIAAAFSEIYRGNLRNMFRYLTMWLVLAGIFASAGQILMFTALSYEKISTVVMISSMEIFIASFLAVVVFRTERLPDRATFIAAILATAGAIAVAVG